MSQWYTYPLDKPGGGYGELPEPLNHSYLKPDTNIAVPNGTAITTWDSGIITDVSNRGGTGGGLSVTQKLNNPPNSQAQYASFNYLGSVSVHVGQLVYPGTQIGTAGSPYGIQFALGLGNNPVWGSGSFPQGTGNPLFDPRQILNKLRGGASISVSLPFVSTNIATTFISVSNNTHQILNNIPGFVGIVDAIDNVEQFTPFQIKDDAGNISGIIGNPFQPGGLLSLPSNAIQATLVFITANTMAALIRLLIIGIGIVILIALVMNITGNAIEQTTGMSPAAIASTALKIGSM